METKARHVLVGAFIVSAFIVLVALVVWLGNGSIDRDYQYYEVVFEDQVSGLSPGSPVEYSGITVGDVQRLRLDPDDPRVVRVKIRVSANTPVKEDTRVRLGLANITGSALIRMQGGSPGSPRLEGSEGSPGVIKAERSALNQLMANSESLIGDVNSFVQNINGMFSEENTERVTRILDNIEQVSEMFADQQDVLGVTLHELSNTLVSVRALSEQVASLAENELSSTLQAVEQGTMSLSSAVGRIDHWIDDNQNALSQGVQGLQSIGPASDELARTLFAIQRLVRELERNPQRLLYERELIEEVN